MTLGELKHTLYCVLSYDEGSWAFKVEEEAFEHLKKTAFSAKWGRTCCCTILATDEDYNSRGNKSIF